MSNRDSTPRAPRTEQERILRGRLLGRRVGLVDGRSGVLQSVWFESGDLVCLVQFERGAAWIDADEIRIPNGTGA